MKEKKENLSGIVAGTLLIASALINFAEFNIERGFCDYPVLIFSALAVLASVVLAVAVMKRKPFWLVGIGTALLLLCRLHEPGISDYIYMAECTAILVILIFSGLRTHKHKTMNLDWSYLIGIVFCGIWVIWQLYYIKGFMNKEMLQKTAVLSFEACQKGFCYLLEEGAVTGLLLDVIIHAVNEEKYENGMELSRQLSVVIAVVLFILAAWSVWPAVFVLPGNRSRGISMPILELFISATFAIGLVHIGLALIKCSKKIFKRGILFFLPCILLLFLGFLASMG